MRYGIAIPRPLTATRTISLIFFLFCLLLHVPVCCAFETLIVSVTLNKIPKGDFYIKSDADGLLLNINDLGAMGLKPPGDAGIDMDGGRYVRLSVLKNISAQFDDRTLILDITIDPSHLPLQVVDLSSRRQSRVEYPDEISMFLNYGVTYTDTHPSSSSELGLASEVGIRRKNFLFLSDGIYDDSSHFVRLMTRVIHDDRKELTRTIMGDYSATSGETGSAVTMAGLSHSKLYRMDPYLINYPTVNISGMAPLPSEIDIYINGAMVRRERFSPGSFQLNNLSSYAGAGTVELVIRDPFGREENIRYPFYISPQLLNEGLHEYSYNLGFLREEFGSESNRYTRPAFSAFHRYGVTRQLTLGARGEGSNRLLNLGGDASLLLRQNLGVMRIGASSSIDRDSRNGTAGFFAYYWDNRTVNLRCTAKFFSDDYTTLADTSTSDYTSLTDINTSASLFPSSELTAGVGFNNRLFGSLSFDVSYTDKRTGPDRSVVSATYSRGIRRDLTLLATWRTVTEGPTSNELLFFLNYTPTPDHSLSAQLESQENLTRTSLQAQKNIPLGEGTSYRVEVEEIDTPGESGQALYTDLRHNARHAALGANYQKIWLDSSSSDSLQLSLSGSIIHVGNTTALTRPVTDSFGVVKVGTVPGVRVYQYSQEMGRTGDNGILVLPSLNSFNENQLSINDKDVPIDFALAATQKFVSPPFRSGSCISFPAERIQPLVGRLQMRDNGRLVPVEFREISLLLPDRTITTMTSRNGEFYIDTSQQPYGSSLTPVAEGCSAMTASTGILVTPGAHTLIINHNGQEHRVPFTVPPSDAPFIDIGTVVWDQPSTGETREDRSESRIKPETAPPADPPAPAASAPPAPAAAAETDQLPPGSPAVSPPAAESGAVATQPVTVHFRTDRTEFTDSADDAALDAFVRIISRSPGCTLEIEAHADQRGSQRYNLRLSRKRAEAIRDKLLARGIDSRTVIKVRHYGERKLLCRHSDSACLQQNRRGIIRIVPAGTGSR